MFFLEKSRKIKRAFYLVFFIIDVLAILTISQFGAIVATVLSLILFVFTFKNARIAGYVSLPISVLPYLIPALPEKYLDSISFVLNFEAPLSEIAKKLYENITVAFENPIFGIGIGKDSYDAYVGAVTERADNLFLGIASSVGMIALFVLIITISLKFLQDSVYSHYVKYSSVHVASAMSTAAISALLILGAFGNLFESPELFFTFFVLFGISSATLRVAKKETDDRLNYYGDARSSQTSAIDINLTRF
jgi:hypothetical protein